MAKKKRYSCRSLLEGVDGYFASISRTVEARERVEVGSKSFEERPILNDAGQPIRYREYVVPPTIWGLCEYLGISQSQWNRYCDRSEHPELQEAVQRAAGLMREWKEQALLTRKDVRGIIYHMQNHLGGLEADSDREPELLSLSEKRELLEELGEGEVD